MVTDKVKIKYSIKGNSIVAEVPSAPTEVGLTMSDSMFLADERLLRLQTLDFDKYSEIDPELLRLASLSYNRDSAPATRSNLHVSTKVTAAFSVGAALGLITVSIFPAAISIAVGVGVVSAGLSAIALFRDGADVFVLKHS